MGLSFWEYWSLIVLLFIYEYLHFNSTHFGEFILRRQLIPLGISTKNPTKFHTLGLMQPHNLLAKAVQQFMWFRNNTLQDQKVNRLLELSSKWSFFAYKIQTLNVSSFLKGNKSQKLRFSCKAQCSKKLYFNCSEPLYFYKVEMCSSVEAGKLASSYFLICFSLLLLLYIKW